MRTLLIDNYDSFTYNLFHLLAEVNGCEPAVVKNDDLAGWAALDPVDFDNVVISPGPGRPDDERDFGLSRAAIEDIGLPLLGVCLGHQGLCQLAGATVRHAPEPVHGRRSAVQHDGDELFADIPSPFQAVRYHSLLAYDLPPSLQCIATTPGGLIMAVRHRTQPQWGVQFHPESIVTEHGLRLLANFRDITARWHSERAKTRSAPAYQVHARELSEVPDSEPAFEALFAAEPCAFWLDSSQLVPGLSRFSFLGGMGGPLAELVTYEVGTHEITIRGQGGTKVRRHDGTVFDYLERELAARHVPCPDLPFEFNLGYVGYLGYELKADCGALRAHASDLPDAALLFCDRMLVIDHERQQAWLLALSTPETRSAADGWLRHAAGVLAAAGHNGREDAQATDATYRNGGRSPASVPVSFRHDLDHYRHLIKECQREICDGESYEICLTNTLTVPGSIDPIRTYQTLRRISPAPFAALFTFPEAAVLSSSPERFLRIGAERLVESKPIKGTRRRGATPEEDAALVCDLRESEKDQAENLMIVDLVRNDLGAVAEVGSVHVPTMFDVETYATVHQLVSTIRATLRSDRSPIACVRAAFPGGSMTGAPKLRTMELIDRFENGRRGVYSGALGYFALSGAVDLSIVIRAMVATEHSVSMGVGGAIVALSDPEDEVNEMLLKAEAMLRALAAVGAGESAAPLAAGPGITDGA